MALLVRYVSVSALTCMFCFGTESTYKRRTAAGLCFPFFALLLGLLAVLEVAFLVVFWILAFFVISPLYLFVRIPMIIFCEGFFNETIKPTCWDQTFGCKSGGGRGRRGRR